VTWALSTDPRASNLITPMRKRSFVTNPFAESWVRRSLLSVVWRGRFQHPAHPDPTDSEASRDFGLAREGPLSEHSAVSLLKG